MPPAGRPCRPAFAAGTGAGCPASAAAYWPRVPAPDCPAALPPARSSLILQRVLRRRDNGAANGFAHAARRLAHTAAARGLPRRLPVVAHEPAEGRLIAVVTSIEV